jgi:hypothetical protein
MHLNELTRHNVTFAFYYEHQKIIFSERYAFGHITCTAQKLWPTTIFCLKIQIQLYSEN